MEAGNRCYDDRVPEEVNRRLIDHSSSVLLPYTERSKENLVREGIDRDRIFITGNPIKEVLDFYSPQIEESVILKQLKVQPFEYFLVTLHRAENVDVHERLVNIFTAFTQISEKFGKEILVSVHPRTAERINQFRSFRDRQTWRSATLTLGDARHRRTHQLPWTARATRLRALGYDVVAHSRILSSAMPRTAGPGAAGARARR